jgi:hypothetical protein
MKNDIEDLPMASVWYVVGGLAAIGLIGLVAAMLAVHSLYSSLVPLHS